MKRGNFIHNMIFRLIMVLCVGFVVWGVIIGIDMVERERVIESTKTPVFLFEVKDTKGNISYFKGTMAAMTEIEKRLPLRYTDVWIIGGAKVK